MKKIMFLILLIVLSNFVLGFSESQFKSLNINCGDWDWIKTNVNVVELTNQYTSMKPYLGGNNIMFDFYHYTVFYYMGFYPKDLAKVSINLGNVNHPQTYLYGLTWKDCTLTYSVNVCKDLLYNEIKIRGKDYFMNDWCPSIKSLQNDLEDNSLLFNDDLLLFNNLVI